MYPVEQLATFGKQARRVFSQEELSWLEAQYDNLAAQSSCGKALGPYWLRELRHGSKRAYFIVGKKKTLLIDASNKNTQSIVIKKIRERLVELKQIADS